MKFTASLDVAPVGSYYNQLAAMLRKDLPTTIRMEAAATVRRAMQMQKHSTVAEVKARAIRDTIASWSGDARIGGSVNVSKRRGERGRMWMRRFDIGRVMPMGLWDEKLGPLADHAGNGWRAPDADWQKFKQGWQKEAKEARAIARQRTGARGIAARSWLEILYKLNSGSTQSVAAFITRARPISGKFRTVGVALTTGAGTQRPTVTVTNSSGIAIAANGQRKLMSAISLRRKAFENAMNKDLFFDASFVARNYPWAKVS